ncbi:MAG: glycosyltransferase family 2 protein, partial [Candidatus Micrarchaeia archaeon]
MKKNNLQKQLAKTTVVIPTLNEEEGIASVIKKTKAQGVKEIVILDGRSKDRTVQIAKKLGARVITQKGKGKGNAFQTFLKKGLSTKTKYCVMIDADCSYDANDIRRIVRALSTRQVACGKRTTVRYNPRDFLHFLGNKGISLIGFVLFGKLNPDICTGLWGFQTTALKKMEIKAQGFDLEADLYAQTSKKNLSLALVPIKYHLRIGKGKL